MRFAFPKKRKKKLPFLPILIVFTGLMMIATIFGEGGVIHALSMRVVKDQALHALEEVISLRIELAHLCEVALQVARKIGVLGHTCALSRNACQ